METRRLLAVFANADSGPDFNTDEDVPLVSTGSVAAYTLADDGPTGTVWKYLDDGSDQSGIDPADPDPDDPTWFASPRYNDAGWVESGPGILGFDTDPVDTTLTAGEITYYFRYTFNTIDVGITSQAQLDQLNRMTFNYKRDDGVAIYLNGVEMMRDNLPEGSDFDDLATDTQGGADERAVNTQLVADPNQIDALVLGENVLSAEVHQATTASSDIIFDLEVIAEVIDLAPILRNDILVGQRGELRVSALTQLLDSATFLRVGTVAMQVDGSFTVTPNPEYHGTAQLTYQIIDDDQSPSSNVVTIVVREVDDPPVAADDAGGAFNVPTEGTAGVPITLGNVLSNDTDVDTSPLVPGGNIFASLVPGSQDWDPSLAAVSVADTGVVTFTPLVTGLSGAYTFRYTARSAQSEDSNEALVTIELTATDSSDYDAIDDAGGPFVTDEDTPLVIDDTDPTPSTIGGGVLANDLHPGDETDPIELQLIEDPDGPAIVISTVFGPAIGRTEQGGQVVLHGDGTFTYTPAVNFFGVDRFTYRVIDLADAALQSDDAEVSIVVNPVNDLPNDGDITVDDYYTAGEGAVITADLPDPNLGAPAGLASGGGAAIASNVLVSDVFLPAGSTWNFSDSGANWFDSSPTFYHPIFNAVATGWLSGEAEFGFGEDDESPTGELTPGETAYYFQRTLTVPDVSADFIDLLAKVDDGAVIYINGVEVARVNVTDPINAETTTDAPIAGDGEQWHHLRVNRNTAGITAPGDYSIAVAVFQAVAGSSDVSFDLIATRGPVSDPTEPRSVIGLLGNDSDADGDPLSIASIDPDGAEGLPPLTDADDGTADGVITVTDDRGTLAVTVADGTFTFTPAGPAQHGEYEYEVLVTDGAEPAETPTTLTIVLHSEDDGPVTAFGDTAANGVQFTTNENTRLIVDQFSGPVGPLGVGVLANDTTAAEDIGDPLTLTVIAQPFDRGDGVTPAGSVVLNDDGSFVYDPAPGFHGTARFTYRVDDGFSESNVAAVDVVVVNLPDPPVTVADAYVTDEDTMLRVTVADPTPQTYITTGHAWDFFDQLGNGQPGVSLEDYPSQGGGARPWNSVDYVPGNVDDVNYGAWQRGPSPFEAGTVSIFNGVPVTPLDGIDEASDGTNAVNTYLFRTTFQAPAGGAIQALEASVVADDGLVIYVNGHEVRGGRINMGEFGDDVEATDLTGINGNENEYVDLTLNVSGRMLDGTNTIAVEVHQTNLTSSDAGFDMILTEVPVSDPGLLHNDSDPDGDTLSVSLVQNQSPGAAARTDQGGEVTARADGTFDYMPAAGFAGTDSFYYKATDDSVDAPVSDWTRVRITVLDTVNAPPQANDDEYSTAVGTTLATRSLAQMSPAWAAATMIEFNDRWKFHDGGRDLIPALPANVLAHDPADPDWYASTTHDDTTAAWVQETDARNLGGPYGYGESFPDVLTTELLYGPDPDNANNDADDKFVTTYFRKTVPTPTVAFDALLLQYQRDDGAAIYVNGVEVVRENVPVEAVAEFDTFAVWANLVPTEDATVNVLLDPATVPLAPAGQDNVIAVELRQSTPTSSDVRFDLQMLALDSASQQGQTSLLANDVDVDTNDELELEIWSINVGQGAVIDGAADDDDGAANGRITVVDSTGAGERLVVNTFDGTFLFEPGTLADTEFAFTYLGYDGLDVSNTATATIRIGARPDATIEARHVFYANTPAAWPATGDNDSPIAADKSVLMPGDAPSLANYTSFAQGLNGLMIDVLNLAGAPDATDFEFWVGGTGIAPGADDPSTWTPLTVDSGDVTIAIQPTAGVGGADRITLELADNLVERTWLLVKVRADGNIGLAADDYFFVGNAIGESGDKAGSTQVDAGDEIDTRNNPRTPSNPAPVEFPYDFDRNQRVDVIDEIVVRNHHTSFLDRLSLTIDTMSLPGVPSAPAEGAARLRLRPPAVSQMGTFPSQAAVNEALSAGRLDSDKQETLVVCQPDSVLEKLAVDRRATAGQGDNSNLGAAFVDELLKEWADWAGGCVAS